MWLKQDEFPEAYRFTASVFPSKDDDVITSPYNALLSLAELTEHADAVFPLENQALMDMSALIQSRANTAACQTGSLLSGPHTGGYPATLVHSAVSSMSCSKCCYMMPH